MTEDNKMTPEKYVHTVRAAVSEFFGAMGTAADVKKLVKKQLDTKRREIFAQVLGFDDRWGRWEVDHCNGRRSAVSDGLASVVQEAGEEWVKDCIKRYTKKSGILGMTKAQEDALLLDYQSRIKSNISSHLYRLAEQHAEKLAKQMAEEATVALSDEILNIKALQVLPEAMEE